MITENMIAKAYTYGIIQLISSPNNDGIACQIGDHWFYFGGHTTEEYDSVEKYKQDIPQDTIVNEIYAALQDFNVESELKAEYDYYESYLKDQLSRISYNVLHIPVGHARFTYRKFDNGDTGLLISVSDKAVEVGDGNGMDKVWKNQVIRPILFIQIDKPEQAEAWSNVFQKLANHMR